MKLQMLTAILLFWLQSDLLAQKGLCHVYGQFREYEGQENVKGGTIFILKDGVEINQVSLTRSGKYDITLPYGFVYDVGFVSEGFFMKKLRFDLRNIPFKKNDSGVDMAIDGTLMRRVEGFNEELLKEPISVCTYNSESEGMEFDSEYAQRRFVEISKEFERLGVPLKTPKR